MHEICIFRVDNGGRELLIAVSFGLAASEAVADRRSSSQIKRWEAYARLYKKVGFFTLMVGYIVMTNPLSNQFDVGKL